MEAVATFSDPQNHFETIPQSPNMLQPEAFLLLPPSFLWFGLVFCVAFSPGAAACSLIGVAADWLSIEKNQPMARPQLKAGTFLKAGGQAACHCVTVSLCDFSRLTQCCWSAFGDSCAVMPFVYEALFFFDFVLFVWARH